MSKSLVSHFQKIYNYINPQSVAFFDDQQSVTFEMLDTYSSNIASNLKKIPYKKCIVGILVERNVKAPAVLLGVLKAGYGFVVLNKHDPLELIIEKTDSLKIKYIIYDELSTLLYKGLSEKNFNLLLVNQIIQESNSSLNNVLIKETDIATYVFTSGSTGKPKAIAISHQSLINRFEWMWKVYPFMQEEVLCHKTSFTFVDYLWEVFGGMMKGIKTLVITDQGILNLPYLISQLKIQNVTRVTFTPCYLELLLSDNHFNAKALPNLNLVISSGEALRSITAQKFHDKFPKTVLLNLYGSTEVTADVTYYEVNQSINTFIVPIGRPVFNNEVYVIKENGEIAEINEIGEIYVYGKNVALHYNDKKLTVQKFVSLKFKDRILNHVFKTGDLGKFDSDNILHYCGRKDNQIKIRGIRIEPREIEHHLLTMDEIKRTVVVKIELTDMDLLTCFIEFNSTKSLSLKKIREFLSLKIPTYKIPDKFLFLDKLPENSNGKIDYLNLKRIFLEKQIKISDKYDIEQNSTTNKILKIWQSEFNNPNIFIKDNFYELGGNSLIAIRIAACIKSELNIDDIEITDIFRYPSVKDLVEILEC